MGIGARPLHPTQQPPPARGRGSDGSCADPAGPMIDNLSLFISHGLILLTCWRLLSRPDLDDEAMEDPRDGFRRATRPAAEGEPDA